jgi:ABC-type branched-subunit amino acid transport system permease subunit
VFGSVLHAIPFDQILIQTINGIVTGMILALVASGLTLIFGIMDVVNFAHGELFMLGAYVGVLVLSATGNFWLALVCASLLIGLLGAVIYLTTLQPLLGRDPLTTILATISTSFICNIPGIGWSSPRRPRRSSAPCGCSSNSAPTASGSAPRRRTASWPRRWAYRCPGS